MKASDTTVQSTRQRRRAVQDEQRAKNRIDNMSPEACELILLRHGQTSWNAEARLQGQHYPGPPLDVLGQLQACAVAAKLKDEALAGIYCSDLLRAMQTAELISRSSGYSIIPSIQLRERNLGILQGLTYAEAQAQHPQAYAAMTSSSLSVAIPVNIHGDLIN